MDTIQSYLQGLEALTDHQAFQKLTLPQSIELPSSIRFGERGYNELEGVIRQTQDGIDLRGMWTEFQSALALWNKQRLPLLNLLSFNVNKNTETVYYPTAEDFEEATEFGEPKGRRIGRPFYMGYDFKWYDAAIRYTWMFLAEADEQQVRALNATAFESDAALLFSKVMKTLFNPTNSSAIINEQNVNVYKLYNADGTVPPKFKMNTFLSSHSHYLASGGAVIDPTDIDDIAEHLWHHGYRVSTVNRMLLLVNRQESSLIRLFKVATGAKYDFIPNSNFGGGVIMPTGQIIAQPAGSVPGSVGTYGPWHIVEEDYIPAGYVVGLVSGGEQNIGNLVGIRQHENAGLRGLRLVKGKDNDYPLTDSFYLHGFGTGIRHRGAGVVMQITVAGSYSPPALYV